ncbi:hypothetical protein BGW42_008181, partial [Actinomortierella wolfii]
MDDDLVNTVDQQQQQCQHQQQVVKDQHAASLIWSTLLAMLDQICVESSPLPVVHKFFMSLSNLIKIKPNLDQDLLEIMATVDSAKILKRACGVLTWINRTSVGHMILARPLTPIDYDTLLIHRRGRGDQSKHSDPSKRRTSGRKAPGGINGHSSSKRHWRRKSLSSIFSQDRGMLDEDLSPLDASSNAGGPHSGRVPDLLAGHEIYPVMFPKRSNNHYDHHHGHHNVGSMGMNPSQFCERCDQLVEGFGAYCYVCDSSLHWDCYHQLQQLVRQMKEGSGITVPSSTIGTNYTELPPTSRWQLNSPDLDGCRLRGEHQLVLVNLFSTLLCYVCRRPLWGHQHQAYRCQGCNQMMHVHCKAEAQRYAEECLQEHHGDIPTATTLERVVTSFRDHYQELIMSWQEHRETRGGAVAGENMTTFNSHEPENEHYTEPFSYEEASTIYSALALQTELLRAALARQELRIPGISSLDDLKKERSQGQNKTSMCLELFDMLEYFEERVEVLQKAQKWSVDLADFFEDDDGQSAEEMPSYLLFHSGYWRHFGSMVKTLMIKATDNHVSQQQYQQHQNYTSFSYGETSEGGIGGIGLSPTPGLANLDELQQYGFEIDPIDLMHQEGDEYGQFKQGPDASHCHSLFSIFRFCMHRLGIVYRWSLRQILQAWVNMGILERQDGSLILFEQGATKAVVSAANPGAGEGSSQTPDPLSHSLSSAPTVPVKAPTLPSSTGGSNGVRMGRYTFRSAPCYFPVVCAIDPSSKVEMLIQAICRCLESIDLSLNECGFQLLVRRCAPDPFMSDYSAERLVGAVLYWLLLEEDHNAHVITELMPRAAAVALVSNSVRRSSLTLSMLPGVKSGIVEQVILKRQALAPSLPPKIPSDGHTKSTSATDSEEVSTVSGMVDHRPQRSTGGLLTSIGSRLRGTAIAAGTSELAPSHDLEMGKLQQQMGSAQNEHMPSAVRASSTRNPYLLTRRLLIERYAIRWLRGINNLDPRRYLEMVQRQIHVLERELNPQHHAHLGDQSDEDLRHNQLERQFKCIARLKQAGFLFDHSPIILQRWQEEMMAYLSSSSKGDSRAFGFQSLHHLFETVDFSAGTETSQVGAAAEGAANVRVKSESPVIKERTNKSNHRKQQAQDENEDRVVIDDSVIIKSNNLEAEEDHGNELVGEQPTTVLCHVLRQAGKAGSDGISKMLLWIELLLDTRAIVPAAAFKSCSEVIEKTVQSDSAYNPVEHSRKLLQLCWVQIAYTTQSLSDKDAYEIVNSMLNINGEKIRTPKQVSDFRFYDVQESVHLRSLVKYALAICMCVYGCPISYVVSLEMTPTEASQPMNPDSLDTAHHTVYDQASVPRQKFMSFLLPKHRLDRQDGIIDIILESMESPHLEVEGEVITTFAAIFDFGTQIDNSRSLMDSANESLIVKIWDMLLPQNDHLADIMLPLLMRCITSKPHFFQAMVESQFERADWELRFIQLDRVFGLFSKLDDAFAMKILFQHTPLERPQSPQRQSELYFEDHEPLRILGFLGPVFSCMVSCIWDKTDAVRTKASSLLRALQPVNVYYALKAWEIYFVSSSMDVQRELCRLMIGLNNQFPGWRIMSYGLIFDLLTVKKSTHHWGATGDEAVMTSGSSRRASLSLSLGSDIHGSQHDQPNAVAFDGSLVNGYTTIGDVEKSSRTSKLRHKAQKKKNAVPVDVEARPASFKHSVSSTDMLKLAYRSSRASIPSGRSDYESDISEDELDSQMSNDQHLEQMERQEQLAREDDLYCSMLSLALQMVANGIEPTLNEVILLKYLVVFYLAFEDCELLNIGNGNQQVHFGQYIPQHGNIYDPGHETFVISICMNLKLILDRYIEIRPDNEKILFGDHPLSSYRSTSTLEVHTPEPHTAACGVGVDDGAASTADPTLHRKSQEQMFRDYVQQQQHLHHHNHSAVGGSASDGTHTCLTGDTEQHHTCELNDPTIFSQRSYRRHQYQQSSLKHQYQQQRHFFQEYRKFYSRRERQDENVPVVGTYFVDVILRFFGAEPDLTALPTERLKNWLELFLIVIYKYVSEQDQLQDLIISLMRKVVDMLLMKRSTGGSGGSILRLDNDYVAKENILLGISICHTLLRRSVKMTALILSREIMAMERLMTSRREDPEDPVRIKAGDFLRDAFEMFLGNGLFLLVFKNQPVPKDASMNAWIEDDYDDERSGGYIGQGHDGGVDHSGSDLFFVLSEVLGETEMVPQDPTSPHSQLVLLRDQPVRDVLDRVMIFKDLQPLQVSRILTNLWLYIERVHSSFHDPKIMADFGSFFIKLSKYMNEWENNSTVGNSNANSFPPTSAMEAGASVGPVTGALDNQIGKVSPSSPGKVHVDLDQIQQHQHLDEKQFQEREAGFKSTSETPGINHSAKNDTKVDATVSKDLTGISDNGSLVGSGEVLSQTTKRASTVTTNSVMTPQAFLESMQSTEPAGESREENDGSKTGQSSQTPQPLQPPLSASIQQQDGRGDANIHVSSSAIASPTIPGKTRASEAPLYTESHKDRLLSRSDVAGTPESSKGALTGSTHTDSDEDDNESGNQNTEKHGSGLFGLLMGQFNSVRWRLGGRAKSEIQHNEEKALEGSVLSRREIQQNRPQSQHPAFIHHTYPFPGQPASRFGTVISTVLPVTEIRHTRLHATAWDIANPVLRMSSVLILRSPLEAFVLVPGLKMLLRQALYRDALSPEAVISICVAYAYMAEMDLSLELTNAFGEVLVEELKAIIKGTRSIRPMACNLILIHH